MSRILALSALLALAAPAWAKVYYSSQGVKFHIGDARSSLSTDAEFLGAYPKVGQEWLQSFTVSEPDTVRVRIDHVWGVDDCPYCKILVSIDSHDMGRLTYANNHEPFTTLKPLAFRVYPGRTYTIKVASYGAKQVDDMLFEGLSVETDAAEVTFVRPPVIKNPEEPMPPPEPEPVPVGDCTGSRKLEKWLPAEDAPRGSMNVDGLAAAEEKELGVKLAAGDYVEARLKVMSVGKGNLVNQQLEFLLGAGEDKNGWILGYDPGKDAVSQANLMRHGRYRAERYPAETYKGGSWNTLRVARCPDGTANLYINGKQLGRGISGLATEEALTLKVRGMQTEFTDKPF